MDRYVLLINGDDPPEAEQKIFVDYINFLVPNKDQRNYGANHSTEIHLLLPWKPIFVACITVSSENRNANCEWNEVSDSVTQETIFKQCASDSSTQSITFDGHVSRSVAQTIHELADQLPCHGTYYLDVLLSCEFLEDVDISDHICLMGALQRLRMWHCSWIYGVLGTKEINNCVKNWCDVLSADILSSETSKDSVSMLWRGRIALAPEEEISSGEAVQHRCQLRLLSQNPFPSFNKVPFIKSDVASKDKEGGWKLSLPSYMELIDECQLSSIPLYIFSLPVMQLCFFQENSAIGSSSNLLSYLTTKPDVALILRLKYHKLDDSSLKNDLHTTEKWKKAVMSGKVDYMRHSIMNPTGHFTFAAAKRSRHDPVVTIYYLCSTNETTNILCDMLKTISIPLKLKPPETENTIVENFFGIPHLDHDMLQRCIETMEALSSEKALLEWISASRSEHGNSSLTVADAASVFNEVVNAIFSKLKPQSDDEQNRSSFCNIEQSSDSWDWPERLYLLKQQIEKDRNSKHESGETASGHAPLFILNNASAISIRDIGKCFKETGEANDENAEVMHPQSGTSYLPTPLEDVTQMPWPEVMSYKFHDVYYNTDLSEKRELSDNRVKRDFLVHETASLCCNSRIVSNHSLSSQNSSPPVTSKKRARKRYAASSKPDIRTAEKKFLRLTSDYGSCASVSSAEGDNTQLEPVRSKSSRLLGSQKSSSNVLQTRVQKSKLLQNNSLFVGYDDLEERHVMKLRAAVVFALEKYDITDKHTLFKPCARKLFAVCKPFVQDVAGKGNTTDRLKAIAEAHAKQVVDFQRQNSL